MDIEKLAREVGLLADESGENWSALYDRDEEDIRPYLARFANAVLEEAAKVAEQRDEDGEGPDSWSWHSKDYAAAIRTLKTPT